MKQRNLRKYLNIFLGFTNLVVVTIVFFLILEGHSVGLSLLVLVMYLAELVLKFLNLRDIAQEERQEENRNRRKQSIRKTLRTPQERSLERRKRRVDQKRKSVDRALADSLRNSREETADPEELYGLLKEDTDRKHNSQNRSS